MATIEELIKNIPDSTLRDQIAREVAKLKATKKFGLVFEDHLPEQALLPGLPVKVGTRVVKRGGKSDETYRVTATTNAKKFRIAREIDGAEEIAAPKDLVIVKRFGSDTSSWMRAEGLARNWMAGKPKYWNKSWQIQE